MIAMETADGVSLTIEEGNLWLKRDGHYMASR
jgi:hypothetical protein